MDLKELVDRQTREVPLTAYWQRFYSFGSVIEVHFVTAFQQMHRLSKRLTFGLLYVDARRPI